MSEGIESTTMTYVPIMAQYIEPGMTCPLGTIKNVEDEGQGVRVVFSDGLDITYPSDRPVFVEIDLEAA